MVEIAYYERILACPHSDGRHPDAQRQPAPLFEGPLCAVCAKEVDVVGVDTVIQGGGTEATATGLLCLCGWGFTFNPVPAGATP